MRVFTFQFFGQDFDPTFVQVCVCVCVRVCACAVYMCARPSIRVCFSCAPIFVSLCAYVCMCKHGHWYTPKHPTIDPVYISCVFVHELMHARVSVNAKCQLEAMRNHWGS